MKWNDIINIVKEKINGMEPWEIMAFYMDTANKFMTLSLEDREFGIPDMDAAIMAIVEAGSFQLNMWYGELHWRFDMPKNSDVHRGSEQKVRIYWDEFILGTENTYTKEIAIPYRNCGIKGFVSVVEAEMDEVMARELANDLLETSKEEV